MDGNVLILGAGFSFDAGIPLLSNFIQQMWEYSVREKAGSSSLSLEQIKILKEALEIRSEMDGYHGRVAFDDRNIEDILSMLAFNQLAGGKADKDKLKAFINAISTTIELSCNVKHSGLPDKGKGYIATVDGSDLYRRFWTSLFKRYEEDKSIPTIITFNYDLVLERALLQVLINKHYNQYDRKLPFKQFSLDYQYTNFPVQYFEALYADYGDFSSRSGGTIIKNVNKEDMLGDILNIEILKLHGSLNFPDSRTRIESNVLPITNVIENPYILPPVSNKQSNNSGNQSWKIALQRLRDAKNVTFVGYSLPKTDMYMQFFLKAALGPNQGLNKINVFDPVLWREGNESKDMKTRYEMCFSEQFRNRINFNPRLPDEYLKNAAGKTQHFIEVLESRPSDILF